MAEALAWIGLASNVLDFLEVGAKFVSKAWNLYHDGEDAADNVPDLKAITSDLERVSKGLQASDAPKDELAQISRQCSEVAAQLLASLRKLGTPQKGSAKSALKTAFKLMWKSDEIEALKARLDGFRQQLMVQLLLSVRNYASKSSDQQQLVLSQLRTIGGQTQRLNAASARNEALGQSILDFLSRNTSPAYQNEYKLRLQQELLQHVYDDRSESGREDSIELSPSRRRRVQKAFTTRLAYTGMNDRAGRIADAHEATFQWIYEEPKSDVRQWSNFRVWLESDEQLYWITGKAGSGKSTLLKYLCDDPNQRERCLQYLSAWGLDCDIIVASYYFWNSGIPLQETQEGLFRSLLYQIILQVPELIPVVSPTRWEALCLFDEDPKDFTITELRQMLVGVAKNFPQTKKICLFLDGLDEFDGDHATIIGVIQQLLVNNHIKVCVASRPWIIFEDSFKHKPSLLLEDLTYDDKLLYVSSKFDADSGFHTLKEREPEFATQLVEEVVGKSQGVFLWITLVVSSLLAGMNYGDRVSDLQRRLDLLPPDLENLYEKILLSLDNFYLEHAAQYFALVRDAPRPMELLTMSFADKNYPKFAIELPLGGIPDTLADLYCDTMRRRINSRCKGLLEVLPLAYSVPVDSVKLKYSYRNAGMGTVQYLHRTVKDYLESTKAREILDGALTKAFDTHGRLCAGYLCMMKIGVSDFIAGLPDSGDRTDIISLRPVEPYEEFIQLFLKTATKVPDEAQESLMLLIDEFDRTGQKIWQAVAETIRGLDIALLPLITSGTWILQEPPTFNITTRLDINPYMGTNILSLAIKYGLRRYVEAKLRDTDQCIVQRAEWDPDSKKLNLFPWSLLSDAILMPQPDLDMIKLLLDHGADPHFRYPSTTVFNCYLSPLYTVLQWAIYCGFYAASIDSKWRSWVQSLGDGYHKRRTIPNIDCSFLARANSRYGAVLRVMIDHGATMNRRELGRVIEMVQLYLAYDYVDKFDWKAHAQLIFELLAEFTGKSRLKLWAMWQSIRRDVGIEWRDGSYYSPNGGYWLTPKEGNILV